MILGRKGSGLLEESMKIVERTDNVVVKIKETEFFYPEGSDFLLYMGMRMERKERRP